MEITKSCPQCRHFSDGFCHLNPPPYPAVAAVDWCGRFSLVGVARGTASKISDETVMSYVRSAWEPVPRPNGEGMIPGGAYQRSSLIRDLVTEHGVSHTPALKRIEKLVARGLLMSGSDPHGNLPGICIWPPEVTAAEEPQRAGRPVAISQDALAGMIAELAPNQGAAVSIRAVHRALAGQASLGAVHAAVKELVTAGRVVQDDAGVYAAPLDMEVDS